MARREAGLDGMHRGMGMCAHTARAMDGEVAALLSFITHILIVDSVMGERSIMDNLITGSCAFVLFGCIWIIGYVVRAMLTETPEPKRRTILIGFHGRKRSGKNTAADLLEKKYTVTQFAIADCLRRAAGVFFPTYLHSELHGEHKDAVGQHGFSPRDVMITIGRAMRERFGHDVFLRMHTDTLRASLTRDIDIVAVTDVRKKPDAALVRRLGGYVVKITRKVADAVPVDDETEEPLPDEWIDFVLENNGTLTEFREKLEALVQPLIEAPGYTAEQMHAIDMLTMHLLEHGFAQDIRDYPPAQKAAFKTMLERAQPGLSKLLTTHIDAPGEDREGAGEHLVQPGDAGGAPSDAGAAGGETS